MKPLHKQWSLIVTSEERARQRRAMVVEALRLAVGWENRGREWTDICDMIKGCMPPICFADFIDIIQIELTNWGDDFSFNKLLKKYGHEKHRKILS